MRILLVNKFQYLKGGAEKHVFELRQLLQDHGHTVIDFGMADPQNPPSPYAEYFVSRTDFSRVRFDWQGVRTATRTIWSVEAARKIDRIIRATKPDIAHVHNIYHQLSPSILPVLKRHQIPVVQTLHDYSLISASYNLFAHHEICEHGKGGKYWDYTKHRCVKNSWAASALSALEYAWHDRMRVYEKNVSLFISPSRFLQDTVRQWGKQIPIEVLPNFVPPVATTTSIPGNYFLFVGRLSEEKGIKTLLEAVKGTSVSLHIAGTGPEEAALKKFTADHHLTNVTFLGQLTGEMLTRAMTGAKALVVPSQWYENCPLVILEAYAHGKAVIGASIGGIPELINDGVTGKLFSPTDVSQLRSILQSVTDAELAAWGLAASAKVRQYTPDRYYDRLLQLYDQARS